MSSEDTTVNREASFKEQLDQIAVERRKAEQPPQPNPIVEKSKSTSGKKKRNPLNKTTTMYYNTHTYIPIVRPRIALANGENKKTVTEYVPAAAKILGSSASEKPGEPEKQIPGPPERPHHDHKIEDFVRDQHRSRNEKGEVELTSAAE